MILFSVQSVELVTTMSYWKSMVKRVNCSFQTTNIVILRYWSPVVRSISAYTIDSIVTVHWTEQPIKCMVQSTATKGACTNYFLQNKRHCDIKLRPWPPHNVIPSHHVLVLFPCTCTTVMSHGLPPFVTLFWGKIVCKCLLSKLHTYPSWMMYVSQTLLFNTL